MYLIVYTSIISDFSICMKVTHFGRLNSQILLDDHILWSNRSRLMMKLEGG